MLNTGRLLEHWHTGSMTRRSFALDAIQPAPRSSCTPSDAADAGHRATATCVRVRVAARHDRAAGARLAPRARRATCFIPFHFREAAANLLTIDAIDPFGKIPEFKFCAVRVEPRGRSRRLPDPAQRAVGGLMAAARSGRGCRASRRAPASSPGRR